jgi:hypothetical protein
VGIDGSLEYDCIVGLDENTLLFRSGRQLRISDGICILVDVNCYFENVIFRVHVLFENKETMVWDIVAENDSHFMGSHLAQNIKWVFDHAYCREEYHVWPVLCTIPI